MKQLTITPQIEAAIKRSTDGSVDPATVAVYEVSSFNTLPVTKRGLFNGARASETTLQQMATYLNSGTNYAPLQIEHNLGEALPAGRTFAGDVLKDESGVAELRTLIYIPRNTAEGPDLITKLDAGVIDEVSVGLQALHLNCSECGFDYRGPDATFSNLYNGICANEHEIGVNGVHVILNGMDKFYEQSLVSRGAAKNTKIISRAKAVMGADDYNRLAASGQSPEIITLFATPTTLPKEPTMDMKELIGELTTAKASVTVTEGKLTAATAQVTELSATIATLTAENATLKTNADATKVAALTTEVEGLKASSAAALEYVRTEANRLAVAANLTAPAADADLEALKASIETSRSRLSTTLPVGGAAHTKDGNGGAVSADGAIASFKTR